MWLHASIVMILSRFPALSAGPSWAGPGAHPIGCATALVFAPVLKLPDFKREFTVTTDASEVSVGGIL